MWNFHTYAAKATQIEGFPAAQHKNNVAAAKISQKRSRNQTLAGMIL
jgi:hypothetical protein